MNDSQRKFCRVTLEGSKGGENIVVLLTVHPSASPRLTDDGRFIRMTDVKRGKEHIFNSAKLIHIQIEDEREQ